MRSPLLLVVFLALAPSAGAVPGAGPAVPVSQDAPADWRRDAADERVKAALLAKGWRLEDDGKALDPETKAPVTKAVLEKAVLELVLDAQRAALETVNLMFSPDWEPDPLGDPARLKTLASELPPGLAAAVLDPKSDPAKVRAMAAAELGKVAAYFDGARSMSDRLDAAQPVAAVPLGPRVNLPYYTSAEQSAGEKLRAAATTEISRDPFGRAVLARLNDAAGKPSLPSFLMEDLSGGVVAHYDFRRQAVVLDREAVLSSVVGTVAPKDRSALRQKLSKRADLLDYLDKNPSAMTAVVRDHDVVIVHELTHAWQDRRDPIFREIARGNIPDSQPLEYEVEAYTAKNLYIRSKLQHDPASVKMDEEFVDYTMMVHGRESWEQDLKRRLGGSSPSRALSVESIHQFQVGRLERTKARAVTTSDEQRAKALDLKALSRSEKQLTDLREAHAKRMEPVGKDIDKGKIDDYRLMGKYYLGQALSTSNGVDRRVWLEKAGRYAKASGDKQLAEEVRKAENGSR